MSLYTWALTELIQQTRAVSILNNTTSEVETKETSVKLPQKQQHLWYDTLGTQTESKAFQNEGCFMLNLRKSSPQETKTDEKF